MKLFDYANFYKKIIAISNINYFRISENPENTDGMRNLFWGMLSFRIPKFVFFCRVIRIRPFIVYMKLSVSPAPSLQSFELQFKANSFAAFLPFDRSIKLLGKPIN